MKTTLIIIAIIIVAIIIFLFYMKFFSKVSVREEKTGPYTFAYTEHVGSYSGVGKPMMELDKKMREAGFKSTLGIGIYYDDPKNTPKEELRSEVGSIISEKDMEKVEKEENSFKFKTMEEKTRIVAEFPYRNMMSYFMGPMKVYPAMGKYMKEKGYNMDTVGTEVYDMENKKIIFMMDIVK